VPAAVIEVALGVADGMNQVFQTPRPYVPGSVQVFIDGQLQRVDYDDGWIELGGRKFQMKIAPVADSDVQVYYRPI
jgi:hypothetical protein